MHDPARFLLAVALVLLFGVDELSAQSESAPEPSCEVLIPDRLESPPARRQMVFGLEAGLLADEVVAVVHGEGLDQLLPMPIERVEDGMLLFSMPVHPLDHWGGGTLEMFISVGEVICPPLTLVVQPLPPAPGAVQRTIETLEVSILGLAAKLGYTRSQLELADPEVLPPEDLMLAAMLEMLAGLKEPSIDSGLEGEVDLALVDALVEVSGLREAAQAFAWMLDQAPPRSTGGTVMLGMGASATALMGSGWPGGRPPPLGGELTPAELEQLMQEFLFWSQMFEGPGGLALDIAGNMLRSMSLVSAFMGAPGKLAAMVTGRVAATISATQLIAKARAGALPSMLHALEVSVEPLSFGEDEENIGTWQAVLDARSSGATLSVADMIGLMPGPGRIIKVASRGNYRYLVRAGVGPEKAQAEALLELSEATELMLAVYDYLRSTVPQVSESMTAEGILLIEPRRWTVSVDPSRPGDKDYFLWQFIPANDHFRFLENQDEFEPVGAGQAELRVSTVPGFFLGQQRAQSHFPVVRSIQVKVEGQGGQTDTLWVSPGEQLDLSAWIEDAHDLGLRWSAPRGGSIEPLNSAGPERPATARFTVPDASGLYVVEADSTSNRGARARGVPRRYGAIAIRAGGLRVEPAALCLEATENAQFRAMTPDGEPLPADRVEWSATAGRIEANGSYTAAARRGQAVITAVDREIPDSSATALVRIGGCDCQWTLNAGNYGRLDGDAVQLTGGPADRLTGTRAGAEPIPDLLVEMEETLPPEAVEAMRLALAQAQGGDQSVSADAAGGFTNFKLGSDELGIVADVSVSASGEVQAIFTMPGYRFYQVHREAEGSRGSIRFEETADGLIIGHFEGRAGRPVSVDPVSYAWLVFNGRFTMNPVSLPYLARTVVCPDPNPSN